MQTMGPTLSDKNYIFAKLKKRTPTKLLVGMKVGGKNYFDPCTVTVLTL